MRLSPRSPSAIGGAVWWQVHHPQDIRHPIVGVERRVSSKACRQLIFSDRGVRWFDYDDRRIRHASPPLPDPTAEPDVAVFLALVRRLSAETPCAIPEAELAAIRTPRDLVRSLRRHWNDAQVAPPGGMSYRQIDAQLEHFAHGALELSEASRAF